MLIILKDWSHKYVSASMNVACGGNAIATSYGSSFDAIGLTLLQSSED